MASGNTDSSVDEVMSDLEETDPRSKRIIEDIYAESEAIQKRLTTEIFKLQHDLEKHRKEFEKFQIEKKELQIEKENLQQTNHILSHENNHLQTENVKLLKRIDVFIKENSKLESRLHEFQRKIEKEEEEERIRQREAKLKLEAEKRERERSRPFYLQEKVSTFPHFRQLQEKGLFFSEYSQISADTKRDVAFYVLNHTARLDTVNLSPKKYEDFRKMAFENNFKRVVVIAMTAGDSPSGPTHLSKYGDQVVTLWFVNGLFSHSKNQHSYSLLHKIFEESM